MAAQWYEVRNDTLMKRTCRRPLPMGVVTRNHALAFAVAMGAGGVGLLYWKVRLPSPSRHKGSRHHILRIFRSHPISLLHSYGYVNGSRMVSAKKLSKLNQPARVCLLTRTLCTPHTMQRIA